jgi:two-component system cell cycle sensor histidine kinase/response regulator CckA
MLFLEDTRTLFRMLGHASLAMQTAFSCLLVCLLEFYYRRVSKEAWLRWFAFSWVMQAAYVASLWMVLDHPSGGVAMGVAPALLGYLVPPTIALTSITLWSGRTPSRRWIAGLYAAGLAAGAITFARGLPYPIDSAAASRIHNIPRYVFYGLASLMAAGAFVRQGRERRLVGSMVTAGAWAFYGLINLVRALTWYEAPDWGLRGAENNPDLVQFALLTFITNSLVWIVMSIGVGLLLTENAERSERRARKALRELEAAQAERSRLAQLVGRSRDAILVASAGQLRYLNSAAADLLGYTPDQIPSLLTRPIHEVCGIGGQDPMRTKMDAAIDASGVWEGQSEWSNLVTGERIPMLVGAVAIEAREGDSPSTGLIGRDLRERVRLEEDLRQAQRQEALGRLAGGIAHDFNNLLTVMMGYASLLLQEDLSERLRQSIAEILTAARRAAAITDRLRAFGRRQTLRAAVLDLNTMVDSMRGALDKLIVGDVQIRYDLCPKPLLVSADATQIEQVLMNLVLNALQSIDGPGLVIVRTGRADARDASAGDRREFVKIEVEDNGRGIEPEVLAHIFDPYFTTRSAGTGLGLSMAYGIIHQSEGQIRVVSRPGHGSIFKVLLPVSDQADASSGSVAHRSGAAATRGSETIMIVDDRPDVTTFVATCLAHYGYRTLVHTDSESALATVRDGSATPQLVIRDVMMPGMALKVFADSLRDSCPRVPILFMSGLPEASVAPLIEGTGGYFIPKPFAPDQLAELVRRVLDATAILTATA